MPEVKCTPFLLQSQEGESAEGKGKNFSFFLLQISNSVDEDGRPLARSVGR